MSQHGLFGRAASELLAVTLKQSHVNLSLAVQKEQHETFNVLCTAGGKIPVEDTLLKAWLTSSWISSQLTDERSKTSDSDLTQDMKSKILEYITALLCSVHLLSGTAPFCRVRDFR